MPTLPDDTRCAFVALIGAPNAGKSTLVNALVGSKVTIVSPKVQTTRTLVRGIAIEGRSQLVFIDTPGIFVQRIVHYASYEKRIEQRTVRKRG